MLFWLIPVVVILAIVGAIFLTKWIRRSANDDSLFDDDQDEAPADDGFNVKILLAVIPLAAIVIWAVLSLTEEYYYEDPYGRSATERAEAAKTREEYGIPNPTAECRRLIERGEKMLPPQCALMD